MRVQTPVQGLDRSQPTSPRPNMFDRESGKIAVQAGDRRSMLDGYGGEHGIRHQLSPSVRLQAEPAEQPKMARAGLCRYIAGLGQNAVDEEEGVLKPSRHPEDAAMSGDPEHRGPDRSWDAKTVAGVEEIIEPWADIDMLGVLSPVGGQNDIDVKDEHERSVHLIDIEALIEKAHRWPDSNLGQHQDVSRPRS